MKQSIALPIVDTSQVGDARRVAARLTTEAGLSEHDRGTTALIVTELAGNLAKYARNGHLVMRALGDDEGGGIEVISIDSGPGIADVAGCLTDGFSSGGTPGTGLGAVRRIARQFEIYSSPGTGTGVMARVGSSAGPSAGSEKLVEFGIVCIAMKGEDRCGDSWGVYQSPARASFMVVDGLGHGSVAAAASDEAVRIFETYPGEPPVDLLRYAHLALRSTRGAVMAMADVDLASGAVSYAGIGNIAGCLLGEAEASHMVSLNGTVGFAANARAYPYRWPSGAALVLCSDGLQSRWQMKQFPGLIRQHPSIIAGMLYQHYARERDDVSVLVARRKG